MENLGKEDENMRKKISKILVLSMIMSSTVGCSNNLTTAEPTNSTEISNENSKIANEYNIDGKTYISVNGYTASNWPTLSDSRSYYSTLVEIQENPEEIISLGIINMAIHQADVFSEFKNIEVLEVSQSDVDDFSFLKHFPNLKVLTLNSNNISDISILEQIPNKENIEVLEVSQSDIDNFSFLKHFPNLKVLDLHNNNISDLSILEQIPNKENLETLILAYNHISDISILSKFPNIKKLFLPGNSFQTLDPIKTMENLERIDLVDGSYDITSLKPLYNLEKLESVFISITTEKNLPQEEIDYFGEKLESD